MQQTEDYSEINSQDQQQTSLDYGMGATEKAKLCRKAPVSGAGSIQEMPDRLSEGTGGAKAARRDSESGKHQQGSPARSTMLRKVTIWASSQCGCRLTTSMATYKLMTDD